MKDSFAGYSVIGWHFSPLNLEYIIPFPAGFLDFCWKNLLYDNVSCHSCLTYLSVLSLCCAFQSLTIMCHGKTLFCMYLLTVLWASYTLRPISFCTVGKLSVIPVMRFSMPLLLSSPSRIPSIGVFVHSLVPQYFRDCLYSFTNIFLFEWDYFTRSFFISDIFCSTLVCCWDIYIYIYIYIYI